MRWPGTSFMIQSFLIQSRLATFHNYSWCRPTAGAGVHLVGSGGQRSAHIWGKCLTKPAIKWKLWGWTTPVPSRIKSIAPIRRQPAWELLNAPASVSLGTVAMISAQRLSQQAAASTSRAISWPFDHCIVMRSSTRMMMVSTGRIPERRAVEGAVLAMAMTMMTARVKRTRRAVRKEPGKGTE